MAVFGVGLFQVAVAFGVLVLASYVGTTLALRAYFEDDAFGPSDVLRVEDPDEGR